VEVPSVLPLAFFLKDAPPNRRQSLVPRGDDLAPPVEVVSHVGRCVRPLCGLAHCSNNPAGPELPASRLGTACVCHSRLTVCTDSARRSRMMTGRRRWRDPPAHRRHRYGILAAPPREGLNVCDADFVRPRRCRGTMCRRDVETFKAAPRRPIAAARTRSVTRPFDLARNPAELNCPLVQGCFDRGQR
jgi:hypothetical protein